MASWHCCFAIMPICARFLHVMLVPVRFLWVSVYFWLWCWRLFVAVFRLAVFWGCLSFGRFVGVFRLGALRVSFVWLLCGCPSFGCSVGVFRASQIVSFPAFLFVSVFSINFLFYLHVCTSCFCMHSKVSLILVITSCFDVNLFLIWKFIYIYAYRFVCSNALVF